MTGRAPAPGSPGSPSERDLLARLGLGPGASNSDIDAAHDEILDFLAGAPGALRTWAGAQADEVDEAYAQLSGAPASASIDLSAPAASAEPTDAWGRPTPAEPTIRGGHDDDFEGFYDRADDEPVIVTRRERRAAQAQAARAEVRRARPAVSDGAVTIPVGTLRRAAVAVVALALVAAVGVGVYGFGQGGIPGLTGTPVPSATDALDTAQIASLMQKIADNPQDTVSLMALANIYYGSGDYVTAQTWLQKVLEVEPQNVDALLALGAAQYNSGDEASAAVSWQKVLAIDPNSIEAHYDLGFMYFSESPPNADKAREEWGKVIALAPDSDIAQTVAAHLATLGGSPLPSAAPSGSPAATESAAPGESPAASATPTASPAPSGSGG